MDTFQVKAAAKTGTFSVHCTRTAQECTNLFHAFGSMLRGLGNLQKESPTEWTFKATSSTQIDHARQVVATLNAQLIDDQQ
jgi:hypothetical protein